MFAFGMLFLKKGAQLSIRVDRNAGSHKEGSAQIGRAALAHVHLSPLKVAGLGNGSVDPCVGYQLGG